MTSAVDFAILAPVPLVLLTEGLEVGAAKPYVAYGSNKWELFREVDALRKSESVPMLIYPSHETDEATTSFQIRWTAWYIGHVQTTAEKRLDEINGHRPKITDGDPRDDSRFWAVFWRVTKLTQLVKASHRPISSLSSYKKGYWRENSPPRGPEIVARPSWI